MNKTHLLKLLCKIDIDYILRENPEFFDKEEKISSEEEFSKKNLYNNNKSEKMDSKFLFNTSHNFKLYVIIPILKFSLK